MPNIIIIMQTDDYKVLKLRTKTFVCIPVSQYWQLPKLQQTFPLHFENPCQSNKSQKNITFFNILY